MARLVVCGDLSEARHVHQGEVWHVRAADGEHDWLRRHSLARPQAAIRLVLDLLPHSFCVTNKRGGLVEQKGAGAGTVVHMLSTVP